VIVSVFVRRLKEGCSFEDFVNEWEADQGFGVPTRVFNAQSLDDPRDVISIGFVAATVEELKRSLAASAAPVCQARSDQRRYRVNEPAMYVRGQDRTRLHP
jgi:hypothetical protein